MIKIITAVFVSSIFTFYYFYVIRPVNKEQSKKKENQCPHGYTDWDQCPDCCH